MRTFKVEPGKMEEIGVRIDAIYNAKGVGQWFSIHDDNGKWVLFAVKEQDLVLDEPLGDRQHRESDPV